MVEGLFAKRRNRKGFFLEKGKGSLANRFEGRGFWA